MNKYGPAIMSLVIPLFTSPTLAADKISDAEFSHKLLGSWIVPSDSTDYSTGNAYTLETFKPDETYTMTMFRDASCTAILRQMEVKWAIENGVLTTFLSDGGKLRDEVLNIENEKMTLHSLDDGTTYTRVKALTCSKALTY